MPDLHTPAVCPLPTVAAALPSDLRPAGHILLVDDDAEIRRLVAELLGRAGYRVSCAEDGEAAWEAFSANPFDLLITDHEMPRLTGLEFLRRVRVRSRDLPAIMISGFMPWDEADLERLLQPGAIIEKPFSMADLLREIRVFIAPNAHSNEPGLGQFPLPIERQPFPWLAAGAAG